MLTELHDYQLTPAGILQVWPTDGAEPYEFPITDLLAWASNRSMEPYEAADVDDFDNNIVTTLYISEKGEEYTHTRATREWWAETNQKSRLLRDFVNAEITGCRATMPAAFATDAEKEQGSADGLPII